MSFRGVTYVSVFSVKACFIGRFFIVFTGSGSVLDESSFVAFKRLNYIGLIGWYGNGRADLKIVRLFWEEALVAK